jgi:hypothetical protein
VGHGLLLAVRLVPIEAQRETLLSHTSTRTHTTRVGVNSISIQE